MTFPGFPPGLPPLLPNAPPLSASDRAWVDGLLPHQRDEAERTLRNISAIFEANRLHHERVEERRRELVRKDAA